MPIGFYLHSIFAVVISASFPGNLEREYLSIVSKRTSTNWADITREKELYKSINPNYSHFVFEIFFRNSMKISK